MRFIVIALCLAVGFMVGLWAAPGEQPSLQPNPTVQVSDAARPASELTNQPVARGPKTRRGANPTVEDGRRTIGGRSVLVRIPDVEVLNYGKVFFRGTVNIEPSVERILAGKSHSHRNDGSVFRNRERRLPQQKRGHYREYVHPTDGLKGAGPQRIITGSNGEWFYTPDHYESFKRLDRTNR